MSYYLVIICALFLYMNLVFVVSIIKKRNDVADIAWGLGFVLLTWLAFFIVSQYGSMALLVNCLVSIWGLRLAWHIYHRNRGKAEDRRYLEWRKQWGKKFYFRSYFQVYILQGILLFLIALPMLIINKSSDGVSVVFGVVGLFVWTIGLYFESVSDIQLAKFTKTPVNKGKLMEEGLWKYTRHPNYFGEALLWWGICFYALGFPNGWFTLISPIVITLLLRFVSGVPMLEKKYANHPDWKEYKSKTAAFIPFVKFI